MMGPALVHGTDQEDRYLATGNICEGVVVRGRGEAGRMRDATRERSNLE
jgi:hypothetical protein